MSHGISLYFVRIVPVNLALYEKEGQTSVSNLHVTHQVHDHETSNISHDESVPNISAFQKMM